MTTDISEILASIDEFETTAESHGLDLRMNLAEIVIRTLRGKDWTQRRLAEETGKEDSFISRVLHGNANCTLDTVGQLMHALGIRTKLKQVDVEYCFLRYVDETGERTVTVATEAISDGQENSKTQTYEVPEEEQAIRQA